MRGSRWVRWRRARVRRDRARRHVSLPARHRAPRDRDRGHARDRGLDARISTDVVRLEDATAARARRLPNLHKSCGKVSRVQALMTIGETSRRSGWSARMLRYLEQEGLVVPAPQCGRLSPLGIRELNQLNALAELRARFGVELKELEFALRLRREPALRAAVETWLAGTAVLGPERRPRPGSSGSSASTSGCSPPPPDRTPDHQRREERWQRHSSTT